MVKTFILFLFTVVSSGIVCAQYDPSSLKDRMEGNTTAQKSASDRLKTSQGDTKSLSILEDTDIMYKLPNGVYESGLLLPNGKIAPAIISKGIKIPACVTKSFELVRGNWNAELDTIECELDQADLAYISDSINSSQKAVNNRSNTLTIHTNENGEEYYINPDGEKVFTQAGSSSTSPQANKYSKTSQKGDTSPGKVKTKTSTSNVPVNPNIYVPPSRNSSSANATAGVLGSDKNKYGITMGTWAKGELLRNVSSAESGLIEIALKEDIPGRYRTLPMGTILFAEKTFNEAEKRLESISVAAILPDGTEVSGISLRVYSLDKTAGLTGSLVRDRIGEIQSSGSEVAISTVASIAKPMAGVAGQAIDGVANSIIDNERQSVPQAPDAFIRVNTQPVLLKVSRSF